MNDYVRGAWESLNYAIKYLEANSKEEAIEEFNILKNKMERGLSDVFPRKLETF